MVASSERVVSFLPRTMERYMSLAALFVAGLSGNIDVEGDSATKVIFFLEMPAPKTRWSCKGMKYSSSLISGSIITLSLEKSRTVGWLTCLRNPG